MAHDRLTRKPAITVIVAVYNGKRTLQRCIDSVASQSYAEKELIIIDACSTDGTIDVLKQNQEKITYWESEPDRGIYHAWNKALEHAKGEWICFLGSDDFLWAPDVLEVVEPHLQSATDDGVRVVYGKVAFVDAGGNIIRVVGTPWNEVRKRISVELSIPHPGTFHHSDLFSEHGKFDENFQIVGDYEFLMRELKEKPARYLGDVITTGFQDGGISNQVVTLGVALKELRHLRRIHGLAAGWASNPSKVRAKMLIAYYMYRMFGEKGVNNLMRAYRYVSRK